MPNPRFCPYSGKCGSWRISILTYTFFVYKQPVAEAMAHGEPVFWRTHFLYISNQVAKTPGLKLGKKISHFHSTHEVLNQ